MKDNYEELMEICQGKIPDDKRYTKRLKWELEEIKVKGKASYFLDLHNRKVQYPSNQNNLLVCQLLGICKDFNIEQDPHCEYGEYPDIDVDYLPIVREYLKTVWAAKTFGADYVCNIGNYTTFGIKSSLIDMARVHGESREEVQVLTKGLEAKDDEGKSLTWDAAMKLYPELKAYCETHPEVAGAARRLTNRNRGSGVHAGGLIIANSPLHDLVPLIKRKDNPQASAWVEGLHGKDLQPVGLVKFDLLVISNLLQIARCCEMVKKRHNLIGICAKPGQPDWSDIEAWRNDPVALAMANSGDLKCIFQFDKETVRKMARSGGVDRFEDLVAYNSLNRPGPLGMKMPERYIERKKGREQFSQHPLVKPILEKTYGVLCYQEQVMRMLNVVGEIPLYDCELVRKAISAKNIAGFIKYKEKFIVNGQKNLGVGEAEITHLWDQIESFAEYGFNLSMTATTLIPTMVCGKLIDRQIKDFVAGDIVLCVNESGKTVETEVVALHDHGELEGFEVTFDDGYQVICSANHKFLTEKGQVPLREICSTGSYIWCDHNIRSLYATEENRRMEISLQSGISEQERISTTSNELQSMQTIKTSTEARKVEIYCQMRRQDVDQRDFLRASESVRQMSAISMEKICRDIFSSLRHGVQYMEGKRTSFENVRELQTNKTKKYSRQDEEIKREQSYSREKKDFLGLSQRDIEKTRIVGSTCCQSQEMARKEPREICQKYRGCLEESQTFKNGNLAKNTTLLDIGKNSMWKRSQASRFCKRQYLDRSRRVLSFFPAQEQLRESVSVAESSSKGSDVKRGVHQERRHNASSVEHGVLYEFDRGVETGLVGLVTGHAPITDTGNLVHRKIVRVRPVGKQQMFDLEVANPTHNFLLPNGVVTSNSHAVAYTYISSWLLYLKAHFPHEFYASILSCETLSEKIKEYKMEAKIHGVDVHRLDINKSGVNFELHGDIIYFGMSNVKGVGEVPAKRIIASQPYKSFEDFLYRFGTDASVLKPLLGLRCFRDADPVTLWKFSEHFKDCSKKTEDKKKRYAASMINYDQQFQKLLPDETRVLADFSGDNPFESDEWKVYDKEEFELVNKEVECRENEDGAMPRTVVVTVLIEGTLLEIEREVIKYFRQAKVKKSWNRWKALKSLWQKRKRSIERHDNAVVSSLPRLVDFDSNTWEIPEELAKEFSNPVSCEEKHYGFAWIHELERSPDYRGNLTFDALKNETDVSSGPVEMKIVKFSKITSKKGNTYFQVIAEDVTGQENRINVWQDDWDWWSSIFEKDNLLRLKLQPPSAGFSTFTLESNQVGNRRGYKKYKNKEDDIRVVVYEHGKKEEEKFLTDEEALAHFSNCTMEQT